MGGGGLKSAEKVAPNITRRCGVAHTVAHTTPVQENLG
jgi:hypothetical protein